jgi:hypothetical protein
LFDDCSLFEFRADPDRSLVFLQIYDSPAEPQSCILSGYLAFLGMNMRRFEQHSDLAFLKFALIVSTTRQLRIEDAVSEAVQLLEASGTSVEVVD